MGTAEQLYLYTKMEIQGLSTNEQLFLLNISWMFSREEIQESHIFQTADAQFYV